jgi:hypothetical protein
MKPYHIHSPFYQAWVDLDSIQAIYDVQVLPDTHWMHGYVPAGMFSIQFAFQDNPKQVHTFKHVNYSEADSTKKSAMFQEVRDEIEGLRKAHDDLVQAWIAK